MSCRAKRNLLRRTHCLVRNVRKTTDGTGSFFLTGLDPGCRGLKTGWRKHCLLGHVRRGLPRSTQRIGVRAGVATPVRSLQPRARG